MKQNKQGADPFGDRTLFLYLCFCDVCHCGLRYGQAGDGVRRGGDGFNDGFAEEIRDLCRQRVVAGVFKEDTVFVAVVVDVAGTAVGLSVPT